MPKFHLFGISIDGCAYSLPTTSSSWSEFAYVGLEFKTLSGIPNFLWAIGGDRQVYVYVYGLDIPIKVKEVAFENQRWLPYEGFSNHLLPTDRYPFSSEDGLEDRDLEKIVLPSSAWSWESKWELELTLDGQLLDHEGWTYAIDFPATYTPQKQWLSCVRRRKWVRYRRYMPLNAWFTIPPLHKDRTKEPFNDLSIGGHMMPGAAPGTMLVWAVSAHGRALFRSGVCTTCPEGTEWTPIPSPSNNEIKQISVGPTGLVWAVLWSGRAVVRKGVTRDCFTGDDWAEVAMPGDGLKISQVSVGTNSVWAVTNCNHVWFRRGIQGEMAGMDIKHAVGNGWVEMVGQLSCVSVASNDQVFGIGSEDRVIYFRTGVSPSTLTGKTWRPVTAHVDENSPISVPSQWFRSESSQSRYRKTSTYSYSLRSAQESNSRSSTPKRSIGSNIPSQPSDIESKPLNSSEAAQSSSPSMRSTTDNCVEEKVGSDAEEKLASEAEESDLCSLADTISINSGGVEPSIVEEIRPDLDDVYLGLATEDNRENTNELSWSWVNAGAVLIEPNELPAWFAESQVALSNIELTRPWRQKILGELKTRTFKATEGFEHYEKAVETTSWKKIGKAQSSLRSGNAYVEDSVLELEWVGSLKEEPDRGTLAILSVDQTSTKAIFNIWDITRVASCSEPGAPRIVIHTKTSHLNGEPPFRLQFASDMEMEDWLATLSHVCSQIQRTCKTPSPRAIWCTTTWGDVFVFDPSTVETNVEVGERKIHEFDVFNKPTPCILYLDNGFPPGSSITLLGRAYKDTERFHMDLLCANLKNNTKLAGNTEPDIALHFNPRFDQDVVVLNTFRNGAWEKEERPSYMAFDIDVTFAITIDCDNECYRISVNGDYFATFKHRIEPQGITHIRIGGKVQLVRLSYESAFDISPPEMYWRQMGGHLWRVESCTAGVTWGIGYDCIPWVYTGGWGGSFLKGLVSSTTGIHPMRDTHSYSVYEYQRWNPLMGYSSHLLPTDRHMWGDVTGRHKKTRECIKLLSMHWQWVTDWAVDYNLPGGVDKEGWQYALDFPATYHAKKGFTDYVRRRRWCRKAQLNLTGPWKEIGNTKLLDISMLAEYDGNRPITLWAVTINGDAFMRKGVTKTCPAGVSWEHVNSDQPLVSISCGPYGQVWAVGRNGSAYWRFGVTAINPTGDVWQCVDPPDGVPIRQLSVGWSGVWVIDNKSRISVRYEVTRLFPEGTHWVTLPSPKFDSCVMNEESKTAVLTPATPSASSDGWRHISAGPMENGEFWAISTAGVLCRRQGITNEHPEGTSWSYGVARLLYYYYMPLEKYCSASYPYPPRQNTYRARMRSFTPHHHKLHLILYSTSIIREIGSTSVAVDGQANVQRTNVDSAKWNN